MKKPYRILVTGSRDWYDWPSVHRAIEAQWVIARLSGHDELVIVHGDCPTGADAAAAAWCDRWRHASIQVTEEPHPAQWLVLGPKAGPIRNQEMVDLGAHVCLSFIKNGSRGATGCTALADDAGIPVKPFTEGEPWCALTR